MDIRVNRSDNLMEIIINGNQTLIEMNDSTINELTHVRVLKHCSICKSLVIGISKHAEHYSKYMDCNYNQLTIDEYNRMLEYPVCYSCNRILQLHDSNRMKTWINNSLLSNPQLRNIYKNIWLDWDDEIANGMEYIFC